MDEIDADQMAAEGLHAKLTQAVEVMLKAHGLDSAILFATWRTNKDSTRSTAVQAGNYYASYGMIKHWQVREDEKERVFVWEKSKGSE